MPANDPILVLQMQRIGDLILTFPLFAWLKIMFPENPVWVVAEEKFFTPLMPLSPSVTYFPWSEYTPLKNRSFKMILNLSIRPEAARLTAELKAETKIGPMQNKDNSTHVNGNWQLYRTSLTRNNRHNLFHWTDLNALDIVPPKIMGAVKWPAPVENLDVKRIGVFLGASEPYKKPSVWFWRALMNSLLKKGYRTVVFGGAMENDFCHQVLKDYGGPVANYCGKLSLAEITPLSRSLSLFITPDTGPMHLAAWAGAKVLNLSMGNVNCHETGPYQPGHWVLKSKVSCYGCWECTKPGYYCHNGYSPMRAASLSTLLAAGRSDSLAKMKVPGLELMQSGYDRHSLHRLNEFWPAGNTARNLLSQFWQRFFGHIFGLWDESRPRAASKALKAGHPKIRARLAREIPKLGRMVAKASTRGLDRSDWEHFLPLARPLASYIQMYLQNNNHSQKSLAESARLIELLANLV